MTTGLLDKNGKEIKSGDMVSLAGNMTTDDTLGHLPNGWFFEDDDIYEVYWDDRIEDWSLRLGVEPDSDVNVKYMNHAVSLLHDERVEVIVREET